MKIQAIPYTVRELWPIDSDTLTAWVDVATGVRLKWRIRLRRIEGGEMDSAEGQLGRDVVARILANIDHEGASFFGNVDELDQFGRHVGDILFKDGSKLVGHLMSNGHHWIRERNGLQRPETAGNRAKIGKN